MILLGELAGRIRAYIESAREECGDVAMGCVRLECRPGFVGIVYEKPGGSSGQFEASYDHERGFTMLSTDGRLFTEADPERVCQRFAAVIDSIPEQRRAAIAQQIAEWRTAGLDGPRLRTMVIGFNTRYEGTRGGQLAPEEFRFATQLSA